MTIDAETSSPTAAAPAEAGFLGPAEVLEATRSGVRARLDDGEGTAVEAGLALAFPYRPAPGDRLLVLGQGGAHWAVGVISGAAPAELEFPGDVHLRAVGGTLTVAGGDGVEVEGPRVTLRAETVRTIAETLTERAESACRWVRDLLTVRAGDSRRTVAGEDFSRSQRSVTQAEELVKIDAKTVHLGS